MVTDSILPRLDRSGDERGQKDSITDEFLVVVLDVGDG